MPWRPSLFILDVNSNRFIQQKSLHEPDKKDNKFDEPASFPVPGVVEIFRGKNEQGDIKQIENNNMQDVFKVFSADCKCTMNKQKQGNKCCNPGFNGKNDDHTG